MKAILIILLLISVEKISAQTDTTYMEVYPQGKKPDFSVVDSWPMFPGGLEGISDLIKKNIQYPKEAHENKIQGLVIVSYIVRVDGAVDEIKVIKSVHSTLDEEAMRVIRLMGGKWKPAIQRGEPVKVLMQQQFNFKL